MPARDNRPASSRVNRHLKSPAVARMRQRQRAATQADDAANAGRRAEADVLLHRVLALDPTNERARRLADRVRPEDGTGRAADQVERWLEHRSG